MNATRDYNVSASPDTQSGVGDHSYCRNPDASQKPWCYVSDQAGGVHREECAVDMCTGIAEAKTPAAPSLGEKEMFESAESLPAQSDGAAVQPVIGISQRVHGAPKKKKDLGTLGYVLGILMMAIIILLGVGITFGYFYKRGRDLQRQHEQRVYEREMQRITLPLSAFSNPACELAEESAVVVSPRQTPCEEDGAAGGADPLMGRAGTPGA
ncbi:phosphoinositide-3-kinase-interacting protein 1-like [Scleropages formosus]|nr:phosphoinositide-3-kinase-interacting protein 1-like [Scleropages formosus]